MRKYLMMIGCVFLLSGCTQSNIVKPTVKQEPNFEVMEGIELDANQIKSDVVEYFDNSDYEFGRSFEYSMDEAGETLTFTIAVTEGTDPKEAADFAASMIRAYNDAVATQDFSYENAKEDNYGGYFETHNVHVRVIPEVPNVDESMWIVDQLIKAGENTPVAPLQ